MMLLGNPEWSLVEGIGVSIIRAGLFPESPIPPLTKEYTLNNKGIDINYDKSYIYSLIKGYWAVWVGLIVYANEDFRGIVHAG